VRAQLLFRSCFGGQSGAGTERQLTFRLASYTWAAH
jgi:hypothetical protein